MTASPATGRHPAHRTPTSRNRVILVSALAAAAVGAAGLAAMALPAGAGTRPSLPDISAEELLASALAARPPAMAGTVRVDSALGLPPLPGLPLGMANGDTELRVWFDGDGRSRVAVPSPAGEQTVIYDGTTVWRWSSAGRTVTRLAQPPAPGEPGGLGGPGAPGEAIDPATAAARLLSVVRPASTVAVDGTARVAGRPVYELVLAPAPAERTLLREIRVALDAETRLPLRLRVLANGTDEPVFSAGFSRVSLAAQDPALFQFTPPDGTTVTEADPHGRPDAGGWPARDGEPAIVGDGWDTVIVAELPDGVLSGAGPGPGIRDRRGGPGPDPKALLDRFATPVDGPWGSGHLISTAVVSVIVTDDGRVAAGAVPQQVLIEALSR